MNSSRVTVPSLSWSTVAIIFAVKLVAPLRVDAETETNGLDLSVHGERAYEFNS